MADMPEAEQKQCFLYQTHLWPVIHSLPGIGVCIKQHPKQILPNVVDKKLETQREHPKMRLGLIAESSPKA